MVYNVYLEIIEDFIKKIQAEGCYAKECEIRQVVEEAMSIIKTNLDKTLEEIIEIMIDENIEELEHIRNKYPIPGYTVSVNVNNIHVKMLGGYINEQREKIPENALFDIASMTKFYTQIIADNLIKEKIFSCTDKIKEIDNTFLHTKLGELTIEDILSFKVSFKTNGRLEECQSIEEALNCLYTMEPYDIGIYNDNDLGMMLLKEVMEHMTEHTYQELLEKYIIKPLNLTDTYVKVPKDKVMLLTGSSNADIGCVNDPNANALGGYSGHAGIFVSNHDLVALGYGVAKEMILSKEALNSAYTKGIKENRGRMGNTYIAHPQGIEMSCIDKLEPKTNFAIRGSTRVQTNIGKTTSGDIITNTILLNPASMGLIKAYREECKINAERVLANKPSQKLVRKYIFSRNDQYVKYDLIDPRQMVPDDDSVRKVTTSNAKLTLKLRLLNDFIKRYDKNNEKEVTLVKRMK